MKRKEFTDLKAKEISALKKLATDKKFEVTKKKMEILGGKDKKLGAARAMRKDLAQILTLIREKEIMEKLESKTKTLKQVQGI